MCLKRRVFHRWILAIFAGLIFSSPVVAYIGPGAGLSAIGSVLALLGAVLLMIVGFVWYPVKRILVRRKEVSLPPELEEEYPEVDESHQKSDVNIEHPGQS